MTPSYRSLSHNAIVQDNSYGRSRHFTVSSANAMETLRTSLSGKNVRLTKKVILVFEFCNSVLVIHNTLGTQLDKFVWTRDNGIR